MVLLTAVAAAVVVMVSEQSHRSDRPLNCQATPSVGAFSCVSPGGLSCKSVCCILDRKSRPIDDEWSLDVSSYFLE